MLFSTSLSFFSSQLSLSLSLLDFCRLNLVFYADSLSYRNHDDDGHDNIHDCLLRLYSHQAVEQGKETARLYPRRLLTR